MISAPPTPAELLAGQSPMSAATTIASHPLGMSPLSDASAALTTAGISPAAMSSSTDRLLEQELDELLNMLIGGDDLNEATFAEQTSIATGLAESSANPTISTNNQELWKSDKMWRRAATDKKYLKAVQKTGKSGKTVRLRPDEHAPAFPALKRAVEAFHLTNEVEIGDTLKDYDSTVPQVLHFDGSGKLQVVPRTEETVFEVFAAPWSIEGPAGKVISPDWELLELATPLERNAFHPPVLDFRERDYDDLRKKAASFIASPIYLPIITFYFAGIHNTWPFLLPNEVFDWYEHVLHYAKTGKTNWSPCQLRYRMGVLMFLVSSCAYVSDGIPVEVGSTRCLASIWEFGMEVSRCAWALTLPRSNDISDDELSVELLLAARTFTHSIFSARSVSMWMHSLKPFFRYTYPLYLKLQREGYEAGSPQMIHFRRMWGDQWKALVYHRCWTHNTPINLRPTVDELREWIEIVSK